MIIIKSACKNKVYGIIEQMQKNKNRKIKISTYDSSLGKPDFSVKVNWMTLAGTPERFSDDGYDGGDMMRQDIDPSVAEGPKMVDFDFENSSDGGELALVEKMPSRVKLAKVALENVPTQTVVTEDTSGMKSGDVGPKKGFLKKIVPEKSVVAGSDANGSASLQMTKERIWGNMRVKRKSLDGFGWGSDVLGRGRMGEVASSSASVKTDSLGSNMGLASSMEGNTMEKQKTKARTGGVKSWERWIGDLGAKCEAVVKDKIAAMEQSVPEVKDESDAVLEEYFADQAAMAEFDAARDSLKQAKEMKKAEEDALDDELSLEALFDQEALEDEPEEKTLEMVDAEMAQRLDKLEAETGVNFDYLRSLLLEDEDSCVTARQQDDATLIKIANTYNVMNMGSMLAKNMLSQDPNNVAAFHDNIVSALATYGSSM